MTGEPVPAIEPIEEETDRGYDKYTNLCNDPEPTDEEDAITLTEITALVRRGES